MKAGLITYNQGSISTKMVWKTSGQEVASQQCNAVVMMANNILCCATKRTGSRIRK